MGSRLALFALAAGFLLLTSALVAGLVTLGLVALVERWSGSPWIASGSFGLAALLAIVVWPRRLLVTPEGIALPEGALLHELGGGEVDEVRLTLAPTVYATRRGEARVLSVGLPVVAVLDGEALRVLAAREIAIARRVGRGAEALVHRARVGAAGLLALPGRLSAPLRLYARSFLRLSDKVVGAAVRAADDEVARTGGEESLRRAETALAVCRLTWGWYWDGDLMTVLDQGVRPPIAQGYARHLALPDVRPVVESAYPDLDFGDAWPAGGEQALVAEAAALERSLLAGVAPEEAADLVGLTWQELGAGPERRPAATPKRPPPPFTARLAATGRGAALFALVLIGATFGPMVTLFVAGALDDTTAEPGALWALAALTLAAGVLLARRYARGIRVPGRLAVDERELVLRGSVVRRPFRVPRERIQAVAVDATGDTRFRVAPDSPWQAPVENAAEALGSHLWDPLYGGPPGVPALGRGKPNLLVLFDVQLPAPRLRRHHATPPRVAGLLLCVDEPEEVRSAAAATPLTFGDLRALPLG